METTVPALHGPVARQTAAAGVGAPRPRLALALVLGVAGFSLLLTFRHALDLDGGGVVGGTSPPPPPPPPPPPAGPDAHYVGNAEAASSHVSPFGANPRWADGCRHVYVDVGSNRGVQVRKLFEGDAYRVDQKSLARARRQTRTKGRERRALELHRVKEMFDSVFGAQAERRRDVCAFGFEPNPHQTPRLRTIEQCYRAREWRTHFFVETVASHKDGNITFYTDGARKQEYWASSVFDHTARGEAHAVRQMSLAHFLRDHVFARRLTPSASGTASADKAAAVVMKIDVEGSEYSILEQLLAENALCRDRIRGVMIEWHSVFVPAGEQRAAAEKLEAEIHQRMSAQQCGDAGPTEVLDIDDESYLHDGPRLPPGC